MALICQVYRSSRRQLTYLFVDRQRGLADVPAALLESFGEPEEVMVLALTPTRRLAGAAAAEVIASIEAQGFYLQLPPVGTGPRPPECRDEP
ncbi:MAG: YcgL domain-containing protein [Halioglobus sp.]|nr:YcgL domain-containing protein [Halioglobus sp.]